MPREVVSGWPEMFALHERDRVEAVISKSHVCISDYVAVRLALGLTYCMTPRLASCPVKRRRLLQAKHLNG
jgi:hypothetical protein